MNNNKVVGALSAVLLIGSAQAGAEEMVFPVKPVEITIPFAQGGGTDQVGRALAEYMAPHLGGDIYASNREGGSGAIGFRYGADAAPDGHVITMQVTTLATAPHTIKGYPVSYRDFEPICLISAPPVVLSVKGGGGITSLDQLVEKANSSARQLTFGTAGPGSYTHLAGVAFTQAVGIEGRFVPYQGSNPALTAAYGGHIDVALSEASEAMPWSSDDRLQVLAVFGDKQVNGLDAPTAAELGVPVEVGAFRGLGAPKGTPAVIMDQLVSACRETTQDEAFLAHMERLGIEVDPLFGTDFGEWLANQHETFSAAATAANLGQ